MGNGKKPVAGIMTDKEQAQVAAGQKAAASRSKKRGGMDNQTKIYIACGACAAVTLFGVLLAFTGRKAVKSSTARYVNDKSFISDVTSAAEGNFTAGGAPFFESMKLDQVKYSLRGIGSSDMVGMPGAVKFCEKDGDVESGVLPSQYDAREEYPECFHPVQDAGNCSAGYAVAAASSLSSRFCIADGAKYGKLQLSSQQILSCDKKSAGCGGGNVDSVWSYIQKRGLYPAECVPYVGEKGAKCSKEMTKCGEDKKLKPLSHCVLSDTKSIKREIQNRGPVVANVDLTEDFLVYQTGIFTLREDSTFINRVDASQGVLQQSVTLVGWGTSQGEGYWIVGNSWGEQWGEKGYARVAIKAGGRRGGRIVGSTVVAVPATAEAIEAQAKEDEEAAKRKEERKKERVLRDERIAEQKKIQAEQQAAQAEDAELEELDLDLEDDSEATEEVAEPEAEEEATHTEM